MVTQMNDAGLGLDGKLIIVTGAAGGINQPDFLRGGDGEIGGC